MPESPRDISEQEQPRRSQEQDRVRDSQTAEQQLLSQDQPTMVRTQFERVPDNPLITRKIVCMEPFVLYPTLEEKGGMNITQVPAVFHVVREGRDLMLVEDAQGKKRGWIEKTPTVYNWNTRLAWSPEPSGQGSLVSIYASMDDATTGKKAGDLRFDSQQVHPVLPVLDIQTRGKKRFARVSPPLPPSGLPSVRFPVWITIADDEGSPVGELGALIGRKTLGRLEGTNRTTMVHLESIADPEIRRPKEVEALLSAEQLAIAEVLTGQSMKGQPIEQVKEAISKLKVGTRTMQNDVGDLLRLNEDNFTAMIEELRFAAQRLSRALDYLDTPQQKRIETFSPFHDEDLTRPFAVYTLFGNGGGESCLFLKVADLP